MRCGSTRFMECLTTSTSTMLMSRKPKYLLVPERVIRQCDLISPYIFIICAKYLNRYQLYATRKNLRNRIKLTEDSAANNLFRHSFVVKANTTNQNESRQEIRTGISQQGLLSAQSGHKLF